MIPQTAAALLSFLFLVAPGIVFETLRERRRPTFEQTTFREVSRIALASLCFSVLSLVLLAVLRAAAPPLMPDPGRWLQEGNRYVHSNYRVVAAFFLAQLVVALALAIGWSWWLGREETSNIRPISAWYRAFRELPPVGADTFVRVIMQSGAEYFGKVIDYTTDSDQADRELFLGEPLWRRLPDETDFTPLRPPWRWLILPGPAIHGVWVSYLQSPDRTTNSAD